MSTKILLIGESCLDKTLTCTHERMSPEDPTAPVYRILKEEAEEGMVHVTSKALWAFDTPHEMLTNCFTDAIVKTRIMVDGRQAARVDQDTKVELSPFEVDWLKKNVANFDAIVISDYGKGLLSPEVIRIVCESGARVYLDPHPNNPLDQYKNLFCVKLNIKELRQVVDHHNEHVKGAVGFLTEEQVILAGTEDVKRLTGAQHVFVTRGPLGVSYVGQGNEVVTTPAQIMEVKQVAGAGDVVMAALISDMEDGVKDLSTIVSNAMKRAGRFVSGEGL